MSKRGNRREHERRLVQSGPKSYPQRVGFSDMSGDNATMSAMPPKGGRGFITQRKGGSDVVVGAIDIASPTPSPSVALPLRNGRVAYVNDGQGDVVSASEHIAGVKADQKYRARCAEMAERALAGDRRAQEWCEAGLFPIDWRGDGESLLPHPEPTPDDEVVTPSATRSADGQRLKLAKTSGVGSASAPLTQLLTDPSELSEAMGMPAAIEAAQSALAAAQEAEKSAKPGEKRRAKERVRVAQESLDNIQDRSDEILRKLATALVGARRASDVDVEIRPDPVSGEPRVYVVTRAAAVRVRRVSDEWRQTLTIQRAVAKILGLSGVAITARNGELRRAEIDGVSTTRRSAHAARQSGHTVHVGKGISLVDAATQVRVEKLSRGSVTVFVSGRGRQVYTRREIEVAMEG